MTLVFGVLLFLVGAAIVIHQVWQPRMSPLLVTLGVFVMGGATGLIILPEGVCV